MIAQRVGLRVERRHAVELRDGFVSERRVAFLKRRVVGFLPCVDGIDVGFNVRAAGLHEPLGWIVKARAHGTEMARDFAETDDDKHKRRDLQDAPDERNRAALGRSAVADKEREHAAREEAAQVRRVVDHRNRKADE